MRNKFLHFVILLISLAILIPAQAKPKKDKKPAAQGTVITSVSASDQSIVLTVEGNKETLTYQAPLGTTITINGEPATLEKLHAGMKVITYTEADEHVLAQIDVSDKAAAK